MTDSETFKTRTAGAAAAPPGAAPDPVRVGRAARALREYVDDMADGEPGLRAAFVPADDAITILDHATPLLWADAPAPGPPRRGPPGGPRAQTGPAGAGAAGAGGARPRGAAAGAGAAAAAGGGGLYDRLDAAGEGEPVDPGAAEAAWAAACRAAGVDPR